MQRRTGKPVQRIDGRWACVLLAPAFMAGAQEPPDDQLDEIVVTATRIETAVRDVARSVSVVGKERIQLGTQQLGLDESLAGVPGLYMQNRFNFAQDLRISLRGFGARSSFGIRGVKIVVVAVRQCRWRRYLHQQ
jgi:iron complex outermembrane receptor protein